MDENVIFIYPLNTILTQLKEELEKDETFTVFEVDMIEEYEQLIENLETSMTFSFDPKKTAQYLELTKKVVSKRTHHNILISKKSPSGLELSRMEKNGLNEYLPDYTQLKALLLKVNLFFKNINNFGGKEISISSKGPGKIDTQSTQRIERLVKDEKILKSNDDEEDEQIVLKNNENDPDWNSAILGQSRDPSVSETKRKPIEKNDPIGRDILANAAPAKAAHTLKISENSPEENVSLDKKTSRWSPEVLAALELPEISYYPGSRVLDPVAFFMEILFNNGDAEFKKKFLKMSLMKVYQTQFYVADQEGNWEEGTPPQLRTLNISDYSVPSWINEGRNSEENIFLLPLFVDDKFNSAIGLLVSGSVGHDKMAEMEFWCYLGRCACS